MRQIALAFALLCAATAARAQQPSPFPDGPGREIVAVACTQCHAPGPIVQIRMSEKGWRQEVQNMVLRGAQIGPADLDAVSSYLATNFGPGVPFPGPTPPPVHLAGGTGANVVEGGCVLCHGLDRIVDTKRAAAQWPAIVHRMVEIGAPLDDDQTKQVIDYLRTNYAAAR